MGSVIPLKKEINNCYIELKNLVENELNQVNQLIKYKLTSEIDLIHKMTNYHFKSGGKRQDSGSSHRRTTKSLTARSRRIRVQYFAKCVHPNRFLHRN